MSYKSPRGASILCNARLAISAVLDVRSPVTFNNVDIGASHFVGTAPYSAILLPAAGAYEFRLAGWRCGGATDGSIQITSTRGVTIVYDQAWEAANLDCTTFHDHFLIPNCQAGDVITMKLSENNTATPVTSITNNTIQAQGNLIVVYWPTYDM